MYRQITINPPLPCVYHDCDGQATVAITYEVSEHEWRMVPTCERHTVPIPQRKKELNDTAGQGTWYRSRMCNTARSRFLR